MTVDIYAPTPQDSVSLAEYQLYREIIAYRATQGLPALPLSKALSTTAGRHVVDTRENIWAENVVLPPGANLHSWSDAYYYEDGRAPEVMWYAPLRLGTGYSSPGYEITAAGYLNGTAALEAWKASPGHRAVLDNSGIWEDVTFASIGVGLETASNPARYGTYEGRVYHVWFGEAADPTGPPVIICTPGPDEFTATPFADIVHGLSGRDRIAGGEGPDQLLGGKGADRLAGDRGNDQLIGGPGHDILMGGAGSDRVNGNAGNDILEGGPGQDTLDGGRGSDQLVGGSGTDWLNGGSGQDFFRFLAAPDGGRGLLRDTIADFESGIDKIGLALIDSRPDLPGDQAFTFIGAAALPGTAGTLSYVAGVARADIDGDGVSDFEIALRGAPRVTEADFLL
jgi:RTX calcium-binding nonapeptide repeat (4 copies)